MLNLNPDAGRTGSIQIGLSAILDEIGRLPRKIILAPVDRPGWSAQSIVKLADVESSSCLSSKGVNGHPVCLVGDDLHKLLLAEKQTPLRDIISFQKFEVEEPLLGLNVDTEDDLVILNNNANFFEQ